eukprot:jgi/Ulvmu1/5133/UM021_0150.1
MYECMVHRKVARSRTIKVPTAGQDANTHIQIQPLDTRWVSDLLPTADCLCRSDRHCHCAHDIMTFANLRLITCSATTLKQQGKWTQPCNISRWTHGGWWNPSSRTPARILQHHAQDARSWSDSTPPQQTGPVMSMAKWVWTIVDSQFLPIALALSLVAGYLLPEAALQADAANISKKSTFVIFIVSGLNMRRGEAIQAMRSRKAFIFGLLSILFITPVAGRFLLQIGMLPFEFVLGLAIFVSMPTSLSANIALAGAVGANTAMSILLTACSNVISIFTVPVMLAAVLGTSGAISFDVVALTKNLIRTVLLPLSVGAAMRMFPQVRGVMDDNRKLFRNLSTLCLAAVPFTQIGIAKASGYTDGLTVIVLVKLVGVIVTTLACIRAFNMFAVNALNLGHRQDHPQTIKRAVILAASQKTLPIAVAVIMQLGSTIGERAGLAILPCVLAHFSQVVIDSLLVSWWIHRDTRQWMCKRHWS